jgi:hypothetical protein
MSTTQGRLDGTDVCNLALAHLGLAAISDAEFLVPSTKQAIIIKRYYRPTRDALLREHSWKGSTVNVALTIAAGIEIDGWDYVYEYPVAVASGSDAGAQFIQKIFTDTTAKNPTPIEYKLFHEMAVADGGQTVIAANEADAYAEITIMGDDEISSGSPNFPGQGVKTYDPIFKLAWSFLMAAMSAVVLTGDKQKAEDMAKWHAFYLDKAKLADARESNVDTYNARHTSSFASAR